MRSDAQIQVGPVHKPAKPIRLREASFEDYPQISALESRFQLYPKNYEEWKHLWTNNPAYREAEGKLPIGWVLENAGGGISGYLGNIPLTCEFQGRKLLAATTRAWVVDEDARSYALLLVATYFKQTNVDLFLNTSVNAEAAQAFSSFQGIRVPVGDWDRSLFWITHYPGFAESLLRQKGAPLVGPLSYPLGAGAFVMDRLQGRGFHGDTVAVTSCPGFDGRFDAFWAALQQKKSHLLMGVRSREVLEWHFKYALISGAAWIYAAEENSRLVAYSVFDRQDYHPVGLTRMRLTDFQCLDEERSPVFLRAMLRTAMERCRRESFHMLELTGLSPKLEKAVEAGAPHRRHLSNWRYFYKANRPWLAEKLKSPSVWEPSFYDGDSSL